MHHVLQLWPAELVELRDAASVDGDECGQLRRAVRRVVVQLEPASGASEEDELMTSERDEVISGTDERASEKYGGTK